MVLCSCCNLLIFHPSGATMLIAIMVFSAHWVETPRLFRENLELSLLVHLLSSPQIKGAAIDDVMLVMMLIHSALHLLKTIEGELSENSLTNNWLQIYIFYCIV